MQLNGSILPVETLMKPTRTQCMTGMDTIFHGVARRGKAWRGEAGRGRARQGKAPTRATGGNSGTNFPRRGRAGQVAAGRGLARPGAAWQGKARHLRESRAETAAPIYRGKAWRGKAWPGKAWPGAAWPGEARRGKATTRHAGG